MGGSHPSPPRQHAITLPPDDDDAAEVVEGEGEADVMRERQQQAAGGGKGADVMREKARAIVEARERSGYDTPPPRVGSANGMMVDAVSKCVGASVDM